MTRRVQGLLLVSFALAGCSSDAVVAARPRVVVQSSAGIVAADGQRIFRTITKFPSNNPWGVVVRTDGIGLVTHPPLNVLSVIDAARQAIVGVISVNSCPSSIVLSPDGHTAYVGSSCLGQIDVVDVDARRLVGFFSTGEVPNALAISSDGAHLYAGTASANIQIINAQSGIVEATLPTGQFGVVAGIALNSAGTLLYATLGQNVFEFDLLTHFLLRTLVVGGNAEGPAITAAQDHLIVANDVGYFSDVILATGFLLNTPIPAGTFDALDVPLLNKALLTSPNGGTLVVYDERRHLINQIIPLGGSPRHLAVHEPSKTAVITDAVGFIDFMR